MSSLRESVELSVGNGGPVTDQLSKNSSVLTVLEPSDRAARIVSAKEQVAERKQLLGRLTLLVSDEVVEAAAEGAVGAFLAEIVTARPSAAVATWVAFNSGAGSANKPAAGLTEENSDVPAAGALRWMIVDPAAAGLADGPEG